MRHGLVLNFRSGLDVRRSPVLTRGVTLRQGQTLLVLSFDDDWLVALSGAGEVISRRTFSDEDRERWFSVEADVKGKRWAL